MKEGLTGKKAGSRETSSGAMAEIRREIIMACASMLMGVEESDWIQDVFQRLGLQDLIIG